jgi:Tol biopolymer transport system component
MRPDGSAVQQITHSGAYYATVSPDGKWLYYMARFKLWKMPVGGGETSQVLALPVILSEVSLPVTARGVYAVGPHQPEGYPVVLYPLDGGKPRTLLSLSRAPSGPLEVSPDGRWLLYATADEPVYGIMLADNFR